MIDQLQRMLAPLRTRILNMIGRAVLSLVDDSTKLQLVQIQMGEDEVRSDIERFQEYGFTSVPQAGAEAVVAFVGGKRDHGLVIAVDDRRYRLTGLQPGEVAMYTDEGEKIHFKRGSIIEIAKNANDFAVKGTTYRTAEDAFFLALATLLSNLIPASGVTGPMLATFVTAKTAFDTAAATYLSSKVKVG